MTNVWENVTKFGLGYCDLPTMVWNADKLLRWLTLKVDRRNTKPLSFMNRFYGYSTAACYIYVYVISMAWFVFWRCQQTHDLLAAVVVLSLGITSEIGMTKLIYMLIYENKIRELIESCLTFDSSVAPGSRYSKNLTKVLRNVKRRAIAFWTFMNVEGVIYILIPLCLPGRHFMEDSFIFFGFEPMYETPNYEICMIINSLAVVFTTYTPSTVTTLLILVTGNIEAHMTCLSEELINISDDVKKYKRITNEENDNSGDGNRKREFIETNKEIKPRLENIVRRHTTTLNLLRKTEDIFRGVMVVEFLIVVIGFIVALLGDIEKTFLELPFVLISVAMDCLIGQRVTDAGHAFENAVYNCKWENFDVVNKKMVLLMLVNSQKPMMLSAGGITTLTFATFMSVVRMIYSAYSVLRTMIK